MQINYNITPRNTTIEYIIIHDTGNTSKGANAYAHFNYFNSRNRNSSADCFVDSENILFVNNYTKYYTWHCGDGKGKNGISNKNSIGIELCINSDGNYEKAFLNLILATAKTAMSLGIDDKNILRHFDVSGKICPQSMKDNDWEKWKVFKKEVKRKMNEIETFKDIENHFAKNHINKLLSYGIVNGDGDGNFRPDDYATRGEIAVIVANALSVMGK